MIGRSKSLLSEGEEKTCKGGGVDLSLLFSQAPGDFLIDFQGYVSNLFFRYKGPCELEGESMFFKPFP